MKYLEFERAVKRRVIGRREVAEYSLAVMLFAAAATLILMAGVALMWFVERLAGVLL